MTLEINLIKKDPPLILSQADLNEWPERESRRLQAKKLENFLTEGRASTVVDMTTTTGTDRGIRVLSIHRLHSFSKLRCVHRFTPEFIVVHYDYKVKSKTKTAFLLF